MDPERDGPRMGRLVLAAAVLLALAAWPAEAHQCDGLNCGPCSDGQFHVHESPTGSCTSGADRFVADLSAVAIVAIVAGAAVVIAVVYVVFRGARAAARYGAKRLEAQRRRPAPAGPREGALPAWLPLLLAGAVLVLLADANVALALALAIVAWAVADSWPEVVASAAGRAELRLRYRSKTLVAAACVLGFLLAAGLAERAGIAGAVLVAGLAGLGAYAVLAARPGVARGPAPAAPAAALADSPRPGAVFLGKYRVERELGRGAFGAAWLAHHLRLERPAVIKQLHPEWSSLPEARARFEREARILAALDHPRVTRIYDVESAGGAWYLVMEYVDGGSLEERLARGPLPRDEAVRILGEVLDGLAYIHAEGVLHRDLKPSNILLARDGGAKIADFGVARSRDSPSAGLTVSGSGAPGTPLYMAPEQVRGQPGDARSDLYAAAVTFYAMVAGSFYLGALPQDDLELRRAVAERPPALPVEGLGQGLNAWLSRALAKAPGERFADARAMRDALHRAALAPASGTKPPSRARRKA